MTFLATLAKATGDVFIIKIIFYEFFLLERYRKSRTHGNILKRSSPSRFSSKVGKFNHGRAYEFRFAALNVNIEIETAGGKRGNALWRCLRSQISGGEFTADR